MKDNEKENKTNVKKTSTVKKETTKKTVAKTIKGWVIPRNPALRLVYITILL